MRSLDQRRDRVNKLYELRKQITTEIAQIEDEIDGELRAMARARNAARLAEKATAPIRRRVAECGTEGGYYRHLRRSGTPACDACKLAHRVGERVRAEARAERGAA